jgi:hypothetical protein
LRISALLGICGLASVQTSYAPVCTQGSQATYRFVGQCAPGDCSGTGVGVLTVQNYTLGAALTNCSFVSFTYTSNVLGTFTVTQSNLVTFNGTGLPASLPAAADVHVVSSNKPGFDSYTNGSWDVGGDDYGSNGTWSIYSATVVPTLSTAALGALGLLLACVGALLVRSRRTARA